MVGGGTPPSHFVLKKNGKDDWLITIFYNTKLSDLFRDFSGIVLHLENKKKSVEIK